MRSDAQLRDSYERAVRARDARTRDSCVAPEALLAVVRGEEREAKRLATLDHAMACVACREELELLRAIEKAGGARTRPAVEGIRWRRHAWIAVAASMLLAVALAQGRGLFHRGAPDAVRGSGPEVVTIAPVGDAVIDRDGELSFAWHAVPGATGYTIELLASEGDVTLARQTRDTTLVLRLAPPLAPGAYRWWVRAHDGDGAERQSALRRIRLE